MPMPKRMLFDTNALLNKPHLLEMADEVVIPYVVLEELDKLKSYKNDPRSYRSRYAVRLIRALNNVVYDDSYELVDSIKGISSKNDDIIISSAIRTNSIFVTGDYLAQLKAENLGIETIYTDEDLQSDQDYKGVTEVLVDRNNEEHMELLASIYENRFDNKLGLKKNEYLVLWDASKPTYDKLGKHNGYEVLSDGKYRGKYKFNGEKLVALNYKSLSNEFLGAIRPRNVKQELMFDMMQDESTTIKASFGSFGVGKDFLMISHAIDQVLNHDKKLVWVRNNVEVKDSNPIGFLPSDLVSKLLPFAMPLCDHLGGVQQLEELIKDEKIEVQHLGFIRGRDIKNSIIYVTECENNTKEHIQLLIGRVGEGSQLWLNGDTRQIDHEKYTYNNGVNALKKLKGHHLYGQVTMDKTERSETARLADLLD